MRKDATIEGASKVDLHNHLTAIVYKGPAELILNQMENTLGIGGCLGVCSWLNPKGSDRRFETLAEQDFGEFGKDNLDGRALYVPKTQSYLLNGIEIPAREGDFVLLGIPRDIDFSPHPATFQDVVQLAKKYNAFLMAVHPFYRNGSGRLFEEKPDRVKYLDAFEVINGEAYMPLPGYSDANGRALIIGEQLRKEHHKLKLFANSDGHSIGEIGATNTSIERVNAENAIHLIYLLRNNLPVINSTGTPYQTSPMKGRIGAIRHIATALACHKVINPIRKLIGQEPI